MTSLEKPALPFEKLLENLNDTDPEIRHQAVSGLKDLGDIRAVPFLIEKLQDADQNVRGATIWALEELGDHRTIEPLTAILKNRKIRPGYLRRAAAEALGKLQAEQAIELLSGIVKDTTEKLEIRLAALEGVSKFDTPQVDELILHAFLDKSNPEDLRYEAVGLMGELPIESSYQMLLDILQGHVESNHIRANAAYALGIFGEDAALQPLLDASTDPDEEVRAWTTNALGHLKLKEALPRLIEILGQDETFDVRSAAASALGILKDPRSVEPLIVALKDKDWEVRWAAITALNDIGDSRAVPALKKMLHDKSAKVVEWAASVLNYFPGTDVAADLEALSGKVTGDSKASQYRRKTLERSLAQVRKVNARKAVEATNSQSKEAQ